MAEESEIDLSEWEQASFKKTLSYSFGFLLVFYILTQFNIYVFYYYEVEIGMPIMHLGLAFIIFAVWNMINDPLLGYLTDRPFRWTRKWGMRFPWILIGGIAFLICWFFLFSAPESLIDQADPWPIFWYFVIVSCALDTFYSLYTTHINAGFTTHFRTDAERRRSSAINATIPLVFALFIGFTVPLFYVYGDRSSMIFAQTLVVIMLFICLIIAIPGIREPEDLKERFLRGYENTGRDPYWKTMKMAFQHRNFVATLFMFMLITLAGTLYRASEVYFFKDILGLPYTFAVYTQLAGFMGLILSIPFWSNVSRKYGHVKTMKLSLLLAPFSFIPILWITTLVEAIIFTFLAGVSVGSFWITLGLINADVYDECTITTGKHQEAMYEGIRTFFFRLALIFQAVIFIVIHIVTGYNPNPNAIQTPLAILGIRIHMGLIPALLAFTAFIIMIRWYDLEGEKQKALKKALRDMGL